MLEKTIFGQRATDLLVAAGLIIGFWAMGKLFRRVSSWLLHRVAGRTQTRLDDLLLTAIQGPAILAITLVGAHLAFLRLELGARTTTLISEGSKAAWTLCFTWLLARTIGAILRQYLVPLTARHDHSEMDRNMLDLSIRTSTIIIWGMGVIAALNNVGYDVSALIAGIGISGLALAMAAKDTVANLFGGVTILADKPFNIGDRIRLGEYDGTVMRIGMRSTRIRTLQGSVVVIPNFKFTDSAVENVSDSSSTHVRHELALDRSTSPDGVQLALGLLSRIVEENQEDLEPAHVASFNAFRDWSLNILFIYRVRKGRALEAVQTKVHIEVLRRFQAAGIELALPTQVGLSRASDGQSITDGAAGGPPHP